MGTTLADRLRWIFEHRHTNASRLAVDAKLKSRSHIRDIIAADEEEGREVSPRGDTLAKVAAVANVPLQWLTSGEGPPPDPDAQASDSTPHTPPAQSTTRRTYVDRIPEYVRDWVIEVLQSLNGKTYTGDQVRAAESYIAGFAFKREQNVVPRRLVLGALEAARAVEVPGEPIDVSAMGAYLAEKNAPDSGPTVEPVETRPMAPALRALVNRRKKERDDQ